ncbi:hypothetical protein AMJ85_03975 [candidate division BRC1 bacterium SM23_51]|nr:MAG: hypothetical protein AMJ85_03975 [candidate division BRC1 bacterium SM23_51]
MPSEVTIMLPGDVPLVLVRVPAGSFVMGSLGDTGWEDEDEAPTHTVTIGYDFYMGKYELTQQEWFALMGSWPGTAPSTTPGLWDSYPVCDVSWNDAQNLITVLNTHMANTSQGPARFRLPSESEWEYACRAGSTTRFCFGDSTLAPMECSPGPAGDLGDYAWFCGNNGTYGTPEYGSKQVGTKLPNQFGLYDMSGNVWEWCQDWYHNSYTGAPADGSAWQTPAGSYRVCRGGYWNGHANHCRSASRGYAAPGRRNSRIGFRLLWTP